MPCRTTAQNFAPVNHVCAIYCGMAKEKAGA